MWRSARYQTRQIGTGAGLFCSRHDACGDCALRLKPLTAATINPRLVEIVTCPHTSYPLTSMSTSARSNLHAIPIPLRPPSDLRQRLLGLAFGLLFNTGCLMITASQILFLFPPRLLIALVPIPSVQRLHEAGVRWTKDCFAKLLGKAWISCWTLRSAYSYFDQCSCANGLLPHEW